MVKPITKDVFFLGQKSEPATKADLQVGKDLQDTAQASRAGGVGMAAVSQILCSGVGEV